MENIYQENLNISYDFNTMFAEELPLTTTELASLISLAYVRNIYETISLTEEEKEKLIKETIEKRIKKEKIIEKLTKREVRKLISDYKTQRFISKLKNEYYKENNDDEIDYKKEDIEKEIKKEIQENKELIEKVKKVIPFFRKNIQEEIEEILKSKTLEEVIDKIAYSIFLTENEKQRAKIILYEIYTFLADEIAIHKVEKEIVNENKELFKERENAIERKTKVHPNDIIIYSNIIANKMTELIKELIREDNERKVKKIKEEITKLENKIEKINIEDKIFYIKVENNKKINIKPRMYIHKKVLSEILMEIAKIEKIDIDYPSIENAKKIREKIIKDYNNPEIEEMPYPDVRLIINLLDKYIKIREKEKEIIRNYFQQFQQKTQIVINNKK